MARCSFLKCEESSFINMAISYENCEKNEWLSEIIVPFYTKAHNDGFTTVNRVFLFLSSLGLLFFYPGGTAFDPRERGKIRSFMSFFAEGSNKLRSSGREILKTGTTRAT